MTNEDTEIHNLFVVGGDDEYSYYNFKNGYFTNAWSHATLFVGKALAEDMAATIVEKYEGITGIHVRTLEKVKITPTNQIHLEYNGDQIVIEGDDLL